jgi:glutathione S-transferase
MCVSTYADLSFVTWDMMIPWIFGDEAEGLQIEKNYPSYYAWNQRLMQRPSVQKISQDKQKAMSGK